METLIGILIPFIGTTAGAACVYFMKNKMNDLVQKVLLGFASGVMIAASVWSLLIPAMDMSSDLGKMAFVPAAVGFLLGIAFLLLLDRNVPHMHLDNEEEGPKSQLKKSTMLVLAVTLHNIPEGMAVGVIFAGLASGSQGVTYAGALALSLGIAIQNFPEGTAIALPMHQYGKSRFVSMMYGQFSGIIEIPAAILGYIFASLIQNILPFALSFAAGAMLFVCVEDMIPEACCHRQIDIGALSCMIGFTVMMILDIMLS